MLAPAVVINFDILAWLLACSGCVHAAPEVAQKPSREIVEKFFGLLFKDFELWPTNPQLQVWSPHGSVA